MAGVKAWLESISLGKYYDVFSSNSIDLDIVTSLSEGDLVELGLTLGDRKRVMRAIDELKQQADTPHAMGEIASPQAPRTVSLEPTGGVSERRHLTLIFADLIGSTQLANQLELEDYRVTLHGFQNLCLDVIRAHQGHVAQFVGDGVVAYFGYPRVQENDAERAATAALELCEAVGRIRHKDGRALAVRVGISSGEVVVDEHSTLGGLVFGEVPNLAARIQTIADPGTVAISDRSKQLIGNNFVCDWKGEHRLKGFQDPIGVWQLVAAEKAALRFRARPAGGATTFVNRDDERRLLESCWRLARGGKGQAVMVSGDAGIGKSCLVETVSQGFEADQYVRLDFQCSPNHEASAHFPVTACISHLSGIRRSDHAEQKLGKLRRLLSSWPESSERALALFAGIMSIPMPAGDEFSALEPAQVKAQLQETMVGIVSSLASRGPVFLLFEDLQWVDPSTEDLIELLIERSRSLPVMIVCTFRRGYRPRWTGRNGVVSIEVKRLYKDHILEMLDNLLQAPQIPAQLKERVASRTDCIPLFAEEMARMVTSRFANADHDLDDYDTLTLPTTLKELFWSMIDKLGPSRSLAPVCAAIGRNILPAMLSAVSERSTADTRAALDELVSAQILVRRGDGKDQAYSFRHALIQEAAYELMLPSRARAVHKRIAEVMATSFGDLARQHPELLAQHYARADMPRLARDAWHQAALISVRRSANEETIRHLRSALDENSKTPPGPERDREEIALRKMLNVALSTRAFGSKEVLENFSLYCELLDRTATGDGDAFLAIHVQYGTQLMRGDPHGALVLCDYLQEIAQRADDAAMRALTAHNIGMSNFMLGRLEAATAAFDRALDLREQTTATELFVYHEADIRIVDMAMRAWALTLQGGDNAAMRDLLTDAVARVSAESHDFTRCYGFNILATAYQIMGDVEPLLELVESALEISGKREFRYWDAWSCILRGWAYTSKGQHTEGIAEINRGIKDYLGTGSTQIILYARTLLADACLMAGDSARGLEVINQVRQEERTWTVRYQLPITDRVEAALRQAHGAAAML